MDVESRARTLLARARDDFANDIRAIAADHAARGLLQSGATAKRAKAAYKDRSTSSLTQVLNEVARRINYRGSKWKAAITAIGIALESHIELADELLEQAFKLAGCEDGDGRRAADALIAAVVADLRISLKEFDEGWTSPEPKGWQERHPIIYAIALLVIGVVIGQLDKLPINSMIS